MIWGILISAALTTGAPAADAPPGQWWDAKWQMRREAVFPENTGAKTFEASFTSCGRSRADGSDVRVVAKGVEVPMRVLSVGPGETVHVVFERVGAERHFIYWDNPGAPAAKTGTIRAGCLLEVRSYAGGEIGSLAAMRQAWAASAETEGVRFVPNIFYGYNPLGSSENFLSRFVGYFRADKGGEYVFATDSDDASFVLVDGKSVAEWPGAHGGAGDARHAGKTVLTPGVHQIEYLHVQGGGGMLIDAAWKPPGAARVEVIPPGAFAPVGAASVRHVERRDGTVLADFTARGAGQAVLNPEATEHLIKMHFENLAAAEVLKEYSPRWFFGDGCTSTEAAPDHVYLIEGDYDVTLVLAKGYDEKKRTMKVHAAADWDRQAGAIDLREDYYDLVKTYDIGKMEPRQAYRAMVYFDRIARRDDVVRAGRALLSRENDLAEETVFDAVKLLAETMRVQEKDLKAARDLLLTHETRMKNAEYAAALALAAGDIDMWHLKDLEAAEACYRRVIFTYAEKADRMTLRKALVRMGDIYRWRHDGEKAREFLVRAQSIPVDDRSPVQRSVRAGFLARSIEEFITQGEMQFAYEFLVQWAWEFPEDQIDGSWTELRVKWLIKNKETPGGIAAVESLLQLNPKTPYAPSLLWLAADCAEAGGDKARAIQLLERVLTDYPEAKNKDAVVKRTEELKKGKK
jgi:tetratricopeptide (TPR) repeat protein